MNNICILERKNPGAEDSLAKRLVDNLIGDAHNISRRDTFRSRPDDITVVAIVPRDLKMETEGRDEEVSGPSLGQSVREQGSTPIGSASVDKKGETIVSF